jgi:hypothetical protein
MVVAITTKATSGGEPHGAQIQARSERRVARPHRRIPKWRIPPIAAPVTQEPIHDLQPYENDRRGRSLIFGIAGERFVLIGDHSVLVERVVPWP